MATHNLACDLWLPAKRETVFAFFSDAHNLENITPPWLRFEVVTSGPIALSRGARIDYRLRVHGIPMHWQSEITVWEPPFRFVDEQRRGPYRRWVHLHTFEEEAGGTLCRDQVEYSVPGGSVINWLLVRRDVEGIFRYRQDTLVRLFKNAELIKR